MAPLPILNVAAYKFVALDDLGRRRRELREFCENRHMRGTILLSTEGINLFVAGKDEPVDGLLDLLQADPAIGKLDIKRSRSVDIPFRRMLVKLKNEIISFGVPGVDPVGAPSPKVPPSKLKQWLDSGRELVLLDVRNDYEVELGTFAGAKPIGVDNFRDFPAAVAELPEELKDKTVVMFCTGGIRCEKAGPMMEQAGFQDIVQLDGGILKYFEDCGGEHYDGECFVFDSRVAVGTDLLETDTTMCFGCQATLSNEDQASPRYLPPKSCPHCYRPPDVRLSKQLEKRHAQIAKVTTPLPGSVPYQNRRPINVPQRCDGFELLAMLKSMHPHVTESNWLKWIGNDSFVRDDVPLKDDSRVRAGERVEHIENETVEPDVNGDVRLLYEDDMLVIIHKPAPLPMHPCGRYNRNTLGYILDQVYSPQRLRMAHRLDANTTGVVVFSRTKNVARQVQRQFERGEVKKQYIARVHGVPTEQAFRCDAPIVPKSATAGSRHVGEGGQASLTEFELLQELADGTSLLRCRPITGRTNQIRIHLSHLGFPIVGDPIYRGDQPMGARQTLGIEEQQLCLHAHRIMFRHPENDQEVEFEAPLPDWARDLELANK